MTRLTRGRTLALFGAALAAGGCGSGGQPQVAVGAKNFTEELILGEIYAQVLAGHGLRVARKLNLGGTDIAMEALRRGEIDLYPEYTGTALLTQLKLATHCRRQADLHAGQSRLRTAVRTHLARSRACQQHASAGHDRPDRRQVRHPHVEPTRCGGPATAAGRDPRVSQAQRRFAGLAAHVRRLCVQGNASHRFRAEVQSAADRRR